MSQQEEEQVVEGAIQAPALLLRPAGLVLRAGAALIDALIFAVILYIGSHSFAEGSSLDDSFRLGVSFIHNLIYYPVLEGLFLHATVGKWLMRIKVVGDSGEGLRLGRSFFRYFLTLLVSILTLGLGVLYMGIQKNKWGLHDMLSKSYVIRR